MKQRIQKKSIDPEQYKKMIRNVEGTMAIEDLTLSKASRQNLDRYANGQANYQQIMAEVKAKYQRAK